MNTVKEKMIKVINDQPDDSSFLEILQELSFLNMIERGLSDSNKDNIIETTKLREEAKLVSPERHTDILKERIHKIKTGNAKFLSLEKLSKIKTRT